MRPSDVQANADRPDGFVLVPDLFSAAAIAIPRDEVPKPVAEDRESVILEADGKAVRPVLSLTVSSVENEATGTVRGAAVCHDHTPTGPLPAGAILEATRS